MIFCCFFYGRGKRAEYNWNNIYSNLEIPNNVKDIAIEVCRNAHKEWYNWICWLDIVLDNNWNALLIDPNFRLNGSTSTLMLKNQMFAETWSSVLKFAWFDSNHSNISTMLKENMRLWKDAMYILSSYRHKITWIIHWHWVTFWDNDLELNRRVKHLNSKWFKI